MTNSPVKIAILDYPGVMQSALYGLKEMFFIANKIGAHLGDDKKFDVTLHKADDLEQDKTPEGTDRQRTSLKVIIIPPDMDGDYYLSPNATLKKWILRHHAQGTIICSVCAGAFILASSGLLDNRCVTTHWGLASTFAEKFPTVKLDINKILINDGDIITAAGLMSWVDLGLELVAQFMSPSLMLLLGKNLIVDTGLREQRYYESFSPKLDHGDQAILKAQHYLQKHFNELVTSEILSKHCILTGRTFLRRFVKATGFKPTQYIQRLRIQKACNLIESTNETFESISLKVGYEDTSAFRKTFLKIIGLTPKNFKDRFSASPLIQSK